MRKWHEWCAIVNQVLAEKSGIKAEMLVPEPPLVEWWQEGVSPYAAAKWAVNCMG